MLFIYLIEHTMLPIFSLILIGFLLDRKFRLDINTLAKLMFYVIVPSFIFENIYETQFPEASYNILAAAFALMALMFIIATVISKLKGYDGCMLESLRNATMFNNSGNLGVALVALVFSHPPFLVDGKTPYLGEAMVVQILLLIVQNVTLNTIGLYQAGRGRMSARNAISVILHMPIVYVFPLVILTKYFELDATQFFLWPIITHSSEMLLPVAMISMGVQLSRTKIQWLNYDVWLASFLKLIVAPVLGLGIVYMSNVFAPGGFTPVAALVFLIYCAVPSPVNSAIFAIEFNNCPEYATQVVMNTTVLSGISIPMFIFLGHVLFSV
ncbi:AEC family transporter [Pectinatus haikarae]|uniref:Permease n=1 Tax=Pectinatus haikarae TaxID=349096 RepID=A0ABT9YBG1_9FIRM|nr:putative permease [Pectinatus haikarae]